MHSLSKILSPSPYRKQGAGLAIALAILVAICLFGRTAKAQTSTYVFDPNQSTVVQTGGIASVHWTYSVKGQFELAVDPNAGTASFAHVDANATDDSPFKRTLDPNHVFNMTTLVGTVIDDATIKFTGKAPDDSDILITLTLAEYSVHLAGQTTPPPGSADFFEYKLDAVAQKKYGGGTGEPNDPYLIYTAEQMNEIGAEPNDWDKHFKLKADIDLFDFIDSDFNIIGNPTFPFSGVFDGNGKKILNFTYTTHTRTDNVGLFRYVAGENAVIKDLGLIDPNIDAGGGYNVGSLVGYVGAYARRPTGGTITGCYVEGGSVAGGGGVAGGEGVGGLVGTLEWGIISNCYATGCSVLGSGHEAEYSIGGLVGWNGVGGRISNCYVEGGSVSGNNCVGGLVGSNGEMGGTITYCYSSGSISGSEKVGGLVGANWGQGTITNCYSIGSVVGTTDVGGLLGCNFSFSNSTITNITNCYAAGSVLGNERGGGLVGVNHDGAVTNSFWDIEVSGQAQSAGGMGLTTPEMQTASTFLDAGWDLINVWGIVENQTYPYLRKYSAADINQDGSVNLTDLAVLADNWLAGF